MNIRRIASAVLLMLVAGVLVFSFPSVNKWIIIVPVALAMSAISKMSPAKQQRQPQSTATAARSNPSKPAAVETSSPGKANVPKEQQKKLLEAATFFKTLVFKAAATDKGVHAETAICAAAWMSGSMLFRGFGGHVKAPRDTKPGTPVFSDEANVVGPKAMNLMLATLNQLGHQFSEQSLAPIVASHDVSTRLSNLSLQEAQSKLDLFYIKYGNASGLSHNELGMASAISAGLIIHECRNVFEPGKGTALAVNALVQGTKTMPVPLPV